ncbi:hypothetical protein ACOQFM_10345 [Stenotrophomonas sepilia]
MEGMAMSLDPQRHPGIADVFYAQRVRERVARGVLEVRGAKAPAAGAPARPAMYVGAFHRILQGLQPQ